MTEHSRHLRPVSGKVLSNLKTVQKRSTILISTLNGVSFIVE